MRLTRFVTITSLVYAATLSVIVLAITPGDTERAHTQSYHHPTSPSASSAPRPTAISGIPAYITLPAHDISLPIDPGHYDNTSGTWTLSDEHAQYATLTTLANDTAGTTLIYGHATPAVFGKLAVTQLEPGTLAQVTSAEGTIFNYTFTHSETLEPDDTTLFENVTSGPPRLVLQTCTGVWSEWRTMYYFEFEGVAQS